MKDWKKITAHPQTSIRDAMRVIDLGARQIVFVVDEGFRLLGTLTDGDIRRALLKGIGLDASVNLVMNSDPIAKTPSIDPQVLREKISERAARQIPIIDDKGIIIGVEEATSVSNGKLGLRENSVVLMAGGLGSRLYPLTQDLPKPLIKVGGRPILETIVTNFADQGLADFYIAVNYKAEMIEDHFGDGSRFGVTIKYLREESKMGTAGALSLLPTIPAKPFIVMNCDVLTNIKFENLLNFHSKQQSAATMAVREYDIQVPYGVVKVGDSSEILAIDEKPTHRFFVNAGIYVLDPSVLMYVKSKQTLDMPQLFAHLSSQNMRTTAFPICEYWIDVGQRQDLERAEGEFGKVFG